MGREIAKCSFPVGMSICSYGYFRFLKIHVHILYQQLIPIYRLILPLENKLNDTTMEAGAESYITSLSYYNSVKLAAKSDVPGAKAIYEDLKKRFAKEKASVPAPENN